MYTFHLGSEMTTGIDYTKSQHFWTVFIPQRWKRTLWFCVKQGGIIHAYHITHWIAIIWKKQTNKTVFSEIHGTKTKYHHCITLKVESLLF